MYVVIRGRDVGIFIDIEVVRPLIQGISTAHYKTIRLLGEGHVIMMEAIAKGTAARL
ncbi:hypothetical protein HGRIS_001652 [Hohenbuehelia grisea]|uniref:Uncharacterized protein n=1 Tax=Hohenbuehelia grisea TaxID=104357 RepID=A0ABR3JJS6_9AGAR